ncbi:hypothetical protein K438DRAFT_684476 [Mycena galopus ATCC 62051]|nr:hypothetical protein K438DRAFT_684476 [Mycena galopus ATCC 62051]
MCAEACAAEMGTGTGASGFRDGIGGGRRVSLRVRERGRDAEESGEKREGGNMGREDSVVMEGRGAEQRRDAQGNSSASTYVPARMRCAPSAVPRRALHLHLRSLPPTQTRIPKMRCDAVLNSSGFPLSMVQLRLRRRHRFFHIPVLRPSNCTGTDLASPTDSTTSTTTRPAHRQCCPAYVPLNHRQDDVRLACPSAPACESRWMELPNNGSDDADLAIDELAVRVLGPCSTYVGSVQRVTVQDAYSRRRLAPFALPRLPGS